MIKEALLEIEKEELSNMIERVLSLRELGNKLHGDSLEVGLNRIINDLTKFTSVHVGKEFFRSGLAADLIIAETIDSLNEYLNLLQELKIDSVGMLRTLAVKYNLEFTNKKDIKVKIHDLLMEKLSKIDIESLSLKCYGEGPLQLNTNPTSSLINECLSHVVNGIETSQNLPLTILESEAFSSLRLSNEKILAVIYNETNFTYSVILIDINDLFNKVSKIIYTPKIKKQNSFTYEIVKFYDKDDKYIFEVRYGKKNANALQRGLWTKTSTKKTEVFLNEENSSFEYIIKNNKYSINTKFLDNFAKVISTGSI
jgi:hypothetical protein